jgi:hypothetical protein
MANKRGRPASKGELTAEERKAKWQFVLAIEALFDMGPASVGRIADDVGEFGTDGDGGLLEDAAIVECLRILVDRVQS